MDLPSLVAELLEEVVAGDVAGGAGDDDLGVAAQVIGVDEHVVRHEALLIRMEVRDLHRLAVVAAG